MNTLSPERQIGGNHYNIMKIQPARFWRANDYDGDACSILKYVARKKNGKEDLHKALSFVHIRIDNNRIYPPQRPRFSHISMRDFCIANGFDKEPAKDAALHYLDAWVKGSNTEDSFSHQLIATIHHMISIYQD